MNVEDELRKLIVDLETFTLETFALETGRRFTETRRMHQDLIDFFSSRLTPDDNHHGDRQALEFRSAAAALLVVCAKSDFRDHPDEERAIIELLENSFGIEHELIEELISMIDEDMVVRGVQQFTSLVNRLYTREDKLILMENLWKVAFADGHLDRFEEQFINRVAFMIRLDANAVQRCRQAVEVANPG